MCCSMQVNISQEELLRLLTIRLVLKMFQLNQKQCKCKTISDDLVCTGNENRKNEKMPFLSLIENGIFLFCVVSAAGCSFRIVIHRF